MIQSRATLRQLDRKLLPFRKLKAIQPRQTGWLKVVRASIGMSQADLARRLGVTQPTVDGYERAEGDGRISLATLRRAAAAVDCDLVYALVPRTSLAATLAARARLVAERVARGTDRSMRLEDQAVPTAETRAQIRDLADELTSRPPRGLWRDPE